MFFCRFIEFSKSVFDKVRTSESTKFQGILSAHCPILKQKTFDKHIFNLSSHTLSLTEKQALCWSLNFCIAPNELQRVPLEAQFESINHQVKDLIPTKNADIATFKNSWVHLSNSYLRAPKEKGGHLPSHISALNSLRRNKDLCIFRSDKGSRVILMDHDVYISKWKSCFVMVTNFSWTLNKLIARKSQLSNLLNL